MRESVHEEEERFGFQDNVRDTRVQPTSKQAKERENRCLQAAGRVPFEDLTRTEPVVNKKIYSHIYEKNRRTAMEPKLSMVEALSGSTAVSLWLSGK